MNVGRHDGETVRVVCAIRHVPEPSAFTIKPFEVRDCSNRGFGECPGRARTVDLARAVRKRVDVGAAARSHEVLCGCRQLGDALAGARFDKSGATAKPHEFERRIFAKDGRRRHQRVATEPHEAELGVQQRLAQLLLEDRERLLGDRDGPVDDVRHEPVFAQSVDGAADELHFMLGRAAKPPIGLGLALPSIPAKPADDGLDLDGVLFDPSDGIAQRFVQSLRNFAVRSFGSHFDRHLFALLDAARGRSACRLPPFQASRSAPSAPQRHCSTLQPPTTIRTVRDHARLKKSAECVAHRSVTSMGFPN